MRFSSISRLTTLVLASVVAAQAGTEKLEAVLQVATDAGLTGFVSAVNAVAGSSEPGVAPIVASLLAALEGPAALFVPNNAAFEAVPASVSSNATLLGNILSYHAVGGNFTNGTSLFAGPVPTNTIGRTLLNSSEFVQLESGQSQVLVWNINGTTVEIENQPQITNVESTLISGNYTISVIDHVLMPPESVSKSLPAAGLDGLAGLVGLVDGLDLDSLRGLTLFAPNEAAIAAAAPTIESIGGNQTVLAAVLSNHLISGTTVYSTDLTADTRPISAAGQQFSFTLNDTGAFVTSGEVTAQIIRTDVLTSNGVIHVIDRVLANTAANAEAGASAAASAASVAATAVPPAATGPVGSGSLAAIAAASVQKNANGGAASNAAVVSAAPMALALVFAGIVTLCL